MSQPIKGGDGVGNLVIQREMGNVDAALLALERDALVRTDGPTGTDRQADLRADGVLCVIGHE
jgi:hypothetical protein